MLLWIFFHYYFFVLCYDYLLNNHMLLKHCYYTFTCTVLSLHKFTDSLLSRYHKHKCSHKRWLHLENTKHQNYAFKKANPDCFSKQMKVFLTARSIFQIYCVHLQVNCGILKLQLENIHQLEFINIIFICSFRWIKIVSISFNEH